MQTEENERSRGIERGVMGEESSWMERSTALRKKETKIIRQSGGQQSETVIQIAH